MLLFLGSQFAWSQVLVPPPPPTSAPPNPTSTMPIQSITPGLPNSTTPSDAPAAPVGPAGPPSSVADNSAIKTKYEEYQSICRQNEYDNINFYSETLRNKRVAYLKEKIAVAQPAAVIKLELRLAKEYLDQGLSDEFMDIQKKLKSKNLNYVENEYLNALTLLNNRKAPAARTTLVNLVKDRSDLKSLVDAMVLLAETYLDMGNYYEAETIYEDLNKEFKNAYLVQQCEAMVLNSSNAEGEKLCIKATEKFSENPFPWIYMGVANREREDLKKAMLYFKKSIRIKPTEMGHTCLAEVYYMNDSFKQSVDEYQKSIEISPDSERALLGLAWSQIKLKNYKEALSAFNQACKMNGKNQFELRKAFKILSEQKINQASDFINLANSCNK